MDATINDLTLMQQLSDIANNGSISTGSITSKSRSMLDTMNNGKCCTLDSDFATTSLDWLDQTATALAGEKMQIMAMAFKGDQVKQAQAKVVKAYDAHEQLVKRMQDLIANWDSHFDASRDQLLKSAGDAITATEPIYAQMKSDLSQSLETQRNLQSSEVPQRQQLVDSLTGWRIKTYLAGGGIAIGLLLSTMLGIVVRKYRRAHRISMAAQTRARMSHASMAHSINSNVSVRKYGRHR